MNRRPFLKHLSIIVGGLFTGIVTAVRGAYAETKFWDQVHRLPQPTKIKNHGDIEKILRDVEFDGSYTYNPKFQEHANRMVNRLIKKLL